MIPYNRVKIVDIGYRLIALDTYPVIPVEEAYTYNNSVYYSQGGPTVLADWLQKMGLLGPVPPPHSGINGAWVISLETDPYVNGPSTNFIDVNGNVWLPPTPQNPSSPGQLLSWGGFQWYYFIGDDIRSDGWYYGSPGNYDEWDFRFWFSRARFAGKTVSPDLFADTSMPSVLTTYTPRVPLYRVISANWKWVTSSWLGNLITKLAPAAVLTVATAGVAGAVSGSLGAAAASGGYIPEFAGGTAIETPFTSGMSSALTPAVTSSVGTSGGISGAFNTVGEVLSPVMKGIGIGEKVLKTAATVEGILAGQKGPQKKSAEPVQVSWNWPLIIGGVAVLGAIVVLRRR